MNQIDTYKKATLDTTLEGFIKEHGTLVKKIALHFKKKLPSTIDVNDIMQSGYVGLLEARATYKPDIGTPFEAFASSRIKGSILDAIRKNSWLTKDSIKFIKALNSTIAKLQQVYGRDPSSEEIIADLNITREEYFTKYQLLNVSNMIAMDATEMGNIPNSVEENPSKNLDKVELLNQLKDGINCLPKKEKTILSLYYNEELKLKEIASIMNLTEARISQIHSAAIAKLKSKILSTKR